VAVFSRRMLYLRAMKLRLFVVLAFFLAAVLTLEMLASTSNLSRRLRLSRLDILRNGSSRGQFYLSR